MKKDQLTESERKLAVLLIRYMQKNPNAKHTAEGIARWWIMQQKFDEEVELIERVIVCLNNIGILKKVSLPDGNLYYKFCNEKLKDNLKLINTLDNR